MFNRIVRETTLAAQATVSNHQLQTLRAAAYLTLDKISDAGGIARWSVEEARHRFWERVVQTYNVCDLTYERDKLSAILGLAREIEVFTRQTYFGGIWLEDVARGLYWYGSDGDERLKKVEAAGGKQFISQLFLNSLLLSSNLELGLLERAVTNGNISGRI
jgi:hypothetical protein